MCPADHGIDSSEVCLGRKIGSIRLYAFHHASKTIAYDRQNAKCPSEVHMLNATTPDYALSCKHFLSHDFYDDHCLWQKATGAISSWTL